MKEMYTEGDFIAAKKQKTKVYLVFFAVLTVYLAAALGLWGYYLTLPYKSPKITGIKVGESLLVIAFIVFAFIYCGIKMRRVSKYGKILTHLQTGITEQCEGEFLRFNEDIEMHDGVDFYTMIVSEWNGRKQEFFERKVLIDAEKPQPELQKGNQVRCVTQGNILLRYEVIQQIEKENQE